jgi:peroxisomal 2,4-dienoyl-CoA reductase
MASIFRTDLLAGKKVFVTGGGTGINKEIVLAFMQHGADAAIMGRRIQKLEEAKAELEAKTGRICHVCRGDVRSVEEVKAAVDAAVRAMGQIDVLVNGAAGNFLATLDRLSYNAFKTVIEIDLLGTFNVIKAVYERTMKHTGGNIINISTTLHYTGTIAQAHAGAAKAGIDALTKVFANELGPKNIRVNGIAPGPIADTVGMDKLSQRKNTESFTELIPLGRYGTKAEVAQAALYLYAADYVTGHTLVVDGGQWMTISQMIISDLDLRSLWRGKL